MLGEVRLNFSGELFRCLASLLFCLFPQKVVRFRVVKMPSNSHNTTEFSRELNVFSISRLGAVGLPAVRTEPSFGKFYIFWHGCRLLSIHSMHARARARATEIECQPHFSSRKHDNLQRQRARPLFPASDRGCERGDFGQMESPKISQTQMYFPL